MYYYNQPYFPYANYAGYPTPHQYAQQPSQGQFQQPKVQENVNFDQGDQRFDTGGFNTSQEIEETEQKALQEDSEQKAKKLKIPCGSKRQMPVQPGQQQPTMPGQQFTLPQVPTNGMLPLELSFIENILRLNRGKNVRVYMTFEGRPDDAVRVFEGLVEEAGRDHIIISDPQTGEWFLLLMVYLDYIEFDEEIEYDYPFNDVDPADVL
ncbi:spore coat protein GerQ [Bacillus shivajii]|uniref:spore coat protein GerQ n=1 Tax=Bacillus shivajii TaxID=1983719 RepID=UPI001CF9B24B|nr:spore coat protein GerQ [Bacillus shivajii]UCZ53083.1 spore coat protein GerQ [Bacillus shivajii]